MQPNLMRNTMSDAVQGSNMADRAYDYILNSILKNQLRPGDWLDRRAIARDLSSSLMPVAEAVQRLTSEGFLLAVPRKGTQVRVPDRSDVFGQLLVREALECQSARIYCGEKIRRNWDPLLKLAQAVDHSAGEGDASQADLAFHQALVNLTGVKALEECFHRTMNLTLYQHISMLAPSAVPGPNQHQVLLQDLSTCDPNQAESLIRSHIRSGKDSLYRELDAASH